jgi:hypothetical protein
MTTLQSVLQTIPPACDSVHFEIRRQAMQARTYKEKKKCEALLPYSKCIALYSEASKLKIKTHDQVSALVKSLKRGNSFLGLVQRVKLGCLGSVLDKVNANPMVLIKSQKRGNLLDGLLTFVETQLPYWNDPKAIYAKQEKDYTLGILNECFCNDILFGNGNIYLKHKWTMKVDSLGLLGDVELSFLIRVYTFSTLMSQPMLNDGLTITNEIVELPDVEELDVDSDADTISNNIENIENIDINLVFAQDDDDIEINFDPLQNSINFEI